MKNLLYLFAIAFSIHVVAQDVTILESDKTYDIQGQKGSFQVNIVKHEKIKIHNESGYPFAYYRNYYDEFRKIKNLTFTIYDANGNKIKRERKGDAVDISISQSYEVTDVRLLYIDPDYKNFPFTVEIEEEVQLDGFISFPMWTPRPYMEVAVEKTSLQITHDENVPIKFYTEKDSLLTVSIEEADGRKTHTYQANDFPAVSDDIDYKTFYRDQPKVLFASDDFEYASSKGSVSSWSALGDWFLSLNESQGGLTEETKAFLDAIDEGDPDELVKEIYHYMQDRTRYISIQLGIGGFQSMPSTEVDKLGYGDCKGLTTYMKSMLEYKGISSNYILVKAGRDVPNIISEFPSNQFNHVFLGVPLNNDTIFLECTSQDLPVNYVSSFTDDRDVLWIEKTNSKIIKSPVYDESFNKRESSANISILENGDAQISLETINSGFFFDDWVFYSNQSEDRVKQFNYRKFDYNDFTISDFSFDKPEKEAPVFRSSYEIEVNNLARSISNKIIVPANLLQSVESLVKVNRYNKYAEIKRAFEINDKLNITFSEKENAIYLPDQLQIESDFGSVEFNFDRTAEGYTVERVIVLKKGIYEKEDFKEFYKFIRKVRSYENTSITIETKT